MVLASVNLGCRLVNFHRTLAISHVIERAMSHRGRPSFDARTGNPYDGPWQRGPHRDGPGGYRGRRGGPRRGRGGYGRNYSEQEQGVEDGRKRTWDRKEGRGGGGGRGRGRGRHPAGLKGKDIGLWYAKQGQKKTEEREMLNRKTIHMDDEQIGRVNYVLFDARRQAEKKAAAAEDRNEQSSSLSSTQEELSALGIEMSESELDEFLNDRDIEETWLSAPLGLTECQQTNERLKTELDQKQQNKRFVTMQEFRQQLPAYKMKEDLLEMINANQVIVISGETGCGKTTQVPQFILDDAIGSGHGTSCRVVCTQPRRISAISVAERVAAERAEPCGSNKSCGYQIRLENKLPRSYGSILYCTTGILLQHMKSDSALSNISHLVLDEIHERDLHTDFLLTIVKGLIQRRKDLKVILMSATLNADLFSSYFNDAPCFHIPGFTYPVDSMYLEELMEHSKFRPCPDAFRLVADAERIQDGAAKRWVVKKEAKRTGLTADEMEEKRQKWDDYQTNKLQKQYPRDLVENIHAQHLYTQNNVDAKLVVATVQFIVDVQPPGAILIFVPGWADIKAVNDGLLREKRFASGQFLIIPLHSLMPTTNQREVFDRPPPGVTKIVVATNIAETSITIDDIAHVIDTGKIKLTEFDHSTNMSTLQVKWISRANAKQRRGRAGRVQDGYCYHLYTKFQEEEFVDFLLPEMLRTPLDNLCLQIRVLKLGKIEEFLEKVMEPPATEAITLSIDKLTALSALDQDQNLTPLGYHLAKLPVEPQIGKMILMGAMFSCLDPVLTIAANLSFKDPFSFALGMEKTIDQRRKQLANGANSDHLMLLNAFNGWEEARNQGHREENDYCWHNFLTKSTLNMLRQMKKQFAEHLCNIGFAPSSDPKDPMLNRLSDNQKVILAIVCSGLYPNICQLIPINPRKPPKLRTKTERKLDFHLKSVNAGVPAANFKEKWLCYYLKMRTNGINLFDASEVSAYPLLFFGGKITTYFDSKMAADVIAVDDWIVFKSKPQIARLVQELRSEMDQILTNKIKDPTVTVIGGKDTAGRVLSSIVDLITTET